MRDYIKHSILGTNPGAAPTTIGFNRGVVAAALLGIINAILVFVPIADDQKLELLAAVNPIVILGSYMVYGFFDQAVRKGGGDAG